MLDKSSATNAAASDNTLAKLVLASDLVKARIGFNATAFLCPTHPSDTVVTAIV